MLGFWWLVAGPLVQAHADLEEQIASVTSALAKDPTNAGLFLRRAELQRMHQKTDESLADLAEAARLAPGSAMPRLGRAKLFVDLARFKDAIGELDAVLAIDPRVSEAHLIRAACHERLGAIPEAIADLTKALAQMPGPQPDTYLDRARLQAATGHLKDAVSGLDDAMARIGAVPGLELAAIEYECQLANFNQALKRIDGIIAKYPVKEPWLIMRGEVLIQAGRPVEARADIMTALGNIAKYPPGRRNIEQTLQLEARAKRALDKIQSATPEKKSAPVPGSE